MHSSFPQKCYGKKQKRSTMMTGTLGIVTAILTAQRVCGFQPMNRYQLRTACLSLFPDIKPIPSRSTHADANAQAEARIRDGIRTLPTVQYPKSLPGDCNVKDYLLENVTPYYGDGSFLAPPTARTVKAWERCEELMEVERQRGILDVDTKTASTITSHGPGYVLSKEEDIIVGLQTEEPLKRACKPRGGFHVVGSALKSYGYQPDPDMKKTYTEVCQGCAFIVADFSTV